VQLYVVLPMWPAWWVFSLEL